MEKEIEQIIEEVRALCLSAPADQIHAMVIDALPASATAAPTSGLDLDSVRHLLGYRWHSPKSEGSQASQMQVPTPLQMQSRLRKITWSQAAVLLGTFMSVWMRVSPLRADLRNATAWSVKFKRRLRERLAIERVPCARPLRAG
jgi:hypothetical protein